MQPTTKTFPVSTSYGSHLAKASEFLIPARHAKFSCFCGLKSGNHYKYGAVSYVGRKVSVHDVFAKLVDSGQRIENVDETIKMIESYILMLQDYRIGNVLTVEPSETDACGFRLHKIADRPDTTEQSH